MSVKKCSLVDLKLGTRPAAYFWKGDPLKRNGEIVCELLMTVDISVSTVPTTVKSVESTIKWISYSGSGLDLPCLSAKNGQKYEMIESFQKVSAKMKRFLLEILKHDCCNYLFNWRRDWEFCPSNCFLGQDQDLPKRGARFSVWRMKKKDVSRYQKLLSFHKKKNNYEDFCNVAQWSWHYERIS